MMVHFLDSGLVKNREGEMINLRNIGVLIVLITQSNFILANELKTDDAKIIYGEDNRIDAEKSPVKKFRDWTKSTAAHIAWNKFTIINGVVKFKKDMKLKEAMLLCSYEKQFREQQTQARCSGFLVGRDLLVTAGHCVKDANDCKDFAWVFDYTNSNISKISEKDVYGCKKLLNQKLEFEGSGVDFALIKLDRAVSLNRKPLDFRTKGKIRLGEELVVIGYPSGLPAKVADGAKVEFNEEPAYFTTNLDTYGGNSGSAVFNIRTGKVEGILVRGGTDYKPDNINQCYKSNVCKKAFSNPVERTSAFEDYTARLRENMAYALILDNPYECIGEDVTRISKVEIHKF